MFEGIKKDALLIPSEVPRKARSLIMKLMQRDPSKRLGAGPEDSEEIKSDPFFEGVDWKEVYERKLSPPPVKIKEVFEGEIGIEVFGNAQGEFGTKMNEWSFADKDFL